MPRWTEGTRRTRGGCSAGVVHEQEYSGYSVPYLSSPTEPGSARGIAGLTTEVTSGVLYAGPKSPIGVECTGSTGTAKLADLTLTATQVNSLNGSAAAPAAGHRPTNLFIRPLAQRAALDKKRITGE